MPDSKQLPHLLRLLDDETPRVRAKVLEALRAFGPQLETELDRLGLSLGPEQLLLLRNSQPMPRTSDFLNRWLECFHLPEEAARIEAGFGLIADYQDGKGQSRRLAELLDDLADEFQATGLRQDALELAHWLFTTRGLSGAADDYYNPRNSNLVHVITHGRGIPLSLACVIILVGNRLGIPVQGCNVPHHFLVRAEVDGTEYIFDPFSGGKLVPPAQLEDLRKIASPEFLDTLATPASPRLILERALSNLIVAHQQAGEAKHSAFFQQILLATRQRITTAD